jgi:hypothetical protein
MALCTIDSKVLAAVAHAAFKHVAAYIMTYCGNQKASLASSLAITQVAMQHQQCACLSAVSRTAG